MKKVGLMFFVLVLIAGCVPSTVQLLRENPSGKSTFVADEGYQQVYRKVVTKARNCFQTGMITAQMVVQGDLYTDIRTGHVSIALHGGLGVSTYANVDIEAISDNETRVTTYYGFPTWSRIVPTVEDWVKLNSDQCL